MSRVRVKILNLLVVLLCPSLLIGQSESLRQILSDLVIAEETGDPGPILKKLEEEGDRYIPEFVDAWRTGEVYILAEAGGTDPRVFRRVSEAYRSVLDGTVARLSTSEIERIEKARPSRGLRRQLKQITDTIDLSSPEESVRIAAARKLGLSQNADYLPYLERRFEVETSRRARGVFEEAILVNKIGQSLSATEKLKHVERLGELKSLMARDLLISLRDGGIESGDEALVSAAKTALKKIESHQAFVEQVGNFFRGLSLGSVLLMVSFGLAITFGLMGIINMAHGEFIAIGGYTCYLVQNLFASQFGVQSGAYQWFFVVSLPVSFLVAALIGIGFEKSFIRFLYRRPLESLLATWGLSMVMQQVFRLIFGAANVQVNTPDFLLGNLEFSGAFLSYTRLFVVGLALFIVIATWLLLSRTNLGLYIRAVMQNRQMAASLGIPVDRVNTLTFAFGCGLASLAGAALSQIGNVGPSMGQTYIVDSFMVVVAGSVGNLLGAGVSAMSIGLVDQFLQPSLGPVMGKITVFAVIILFLQWRPGGLFPTKSRSLED